MLQRVSRSSWKPSRGGAMVVLGLIGFGLLILGGLCLTPKAYAPAVPPNVPVGVPRKTLRFVCYDLARQHPINDPMFAEIIKLKPDYLLLQGVEEDDATEIVQFLGLQHFHPQLYQRSEFLAGRKGTWGNLIVARNPLYQGAPLGGVRGGFGVSAVSVVEGHRFSLACLHLSPAEKGNAEMAEFLQTWKAQGSPPMVLAVLPSDDTPPAGLAEFPAQSTAGGQWLALSKEWTITAHGSAPAAGSGRAPMWIDATRKTPEK